MNESEFQDACRQDLARRLEELDRADDRTFGEFTLFDFLAALFFCIILPLAVVFIFR